EPTRRAIPALEASCPRTALRLTRRRASPRRRVRHRVKGMARIAGRRKTNTEADTHGIAGADMTLTILHTADCHLGRRLAWLPPEQESRLTRARLDVVGRILDVANNRNVDAVLVAGDIFDGPTPDDLWWQGLQAEFRERNWNRPVVLLPGNHDPLMARSVFA